MPTQAQQAFLDTYGPLADDISAATGLDRNLVLGHAALESGWGQHHTGNNLFGISPNGKPASYPDIPTAAQAYVDLLKSPRYAAALKSSDPVRAITAAGYNSANPKYADTLGAMTNIVRGLTAPQQDDGLPTVAQINVGGRKFTVDGRYADNFRGFLTDLAGTGYKIDDVQGFNDRNIAGTDTRSYHAGGHAIDINPGRNPQGKAGDLPANVGELAAKWGLGHGASFGDPMHFSVSDEEGGAYPVAHLQPGQHARFAQPGQTFMPAARPKPADDPDAAAGEALFRQMTGGAPAKPSAAAPAAPGDSDAAQGEALFKQLTAPAAPAAPAMAPGTFQSKTATGAPGPVYDANVDTPLPSGGTGLNALPPPSRLIAAATNALEPAPNTTYGNILPFAVDDKTGERRWALPNALRDPALGALHLLDSPSTGTLTPGDTATLGMALVPNPLARAPDLPGVAGARMLPRWTPEGIKYDPIKPSAAEVKAANAPSALSPVAQRIAEIKARPDVQPQPNALQLGPDGKPVAPSPAPTPLAAASGSPQAVPGTIPFDRFRTEMLRDALHAGGPAEVERAGAAAASEYAAYQAEVARLANGGAPRPGGSWGQDIAAEQARVPGAEGRVTPPAAAGAPPEQRPAGPNQPGAAGELRAAGADVNLAPIPEGTQGDRWRGMQTDLNQTAEERATVTTGPDGQRTLVDTNQYFPGVVRPHSAQHFNAQNAFDHKTLHSTDTGYHGATEQNFDASRATIHEGLQNLAGDARTTERLVAARKDLAPDFSNQKPVPVEEWQKVVTNLDQAIAATRKVDPVRSVLERMRGKLFTEDGQPDLMPDQLYGVRKAIDHELDRKPGYDAGDAANAAKHFLMGAREVLDPVIELGNPGFAEFRANWSAASRAIDREKYLQSLFTNTGRTNLTPDMMRTAMSKILRDQRTSPVHEANAVTESDWQTIVAARNELAAYALRDKMAGVRGSPTVQLANRAAVLGTGPLGAGIKGAAEVLLHAGLAASTSGVGNALVLGYKHIYKPGVEAARARQAAAALEATKARLLSTTPNPLTPP